MKKLVLCKWTLKILLELLKTPQRPSQLKRNISGISERVLFDRLRKLYESGIVSKQSNNSYPLVTYYSLVNKDFITPIADLINKLNVDENEIISFITCKWTFNIMNLLTNELQSKEIKENLPGISDKILYDRLNQLLKKGLVFRNIYPEHKPPRVTYILTPEGMKVKQLIENLNKLLTTWSSRKI